MKTICIYHNIDLDGWMSAAIVKHWFIKQDTTNGVVLNDNFVVINGSDAVKINELHFIGYNYGQPIPDLSEYDKVIMCDVSFPKEVMGELYNSGKLTWIDHHISAINHYKSLNLSFPRGLQDTKYAACELTWKFFFTEELMPEIVRLLGRYDCFGHKNTDEETKVLEFQYGARQCIINYEEAYTYLICCISDEIPIHKYKIGPSTGRTVNNIWNKGISIYQYLCTEAKQTYKNGFEIRLFTYTDEDHMNPHKFICINKERFNPINFGIDYHKDGYDGCACFYFDGTNYNFSLYNDNGLVDCSQIAKQYGGGGHKGDSGMRLTPKQFNDLIF